MKNNDLQNKVLSTLNERAQNHQKQHIVIQNVFAKIEHNTHSKFNRWGLTGFALAAAITGVVVIPSTFLNDASNESKIIVNTPKLSPQLAEDLEMLLVLGEDAIHGS